MFKYRTYRGKERKYSHPIIIGFSLHNRYSVDITSAVNCKKLQLRPLPFVRYIFKLRINCVSIHRLIIMIPSSGQSLRYYLRYRKVDSGIVNNSFISSFVFEQGRNNSGRRKNNNSPQYNSFPPPNSSRFYSSIRPISVQSKASKWGRLSSSLPTVFRSPSSSSSSFIPSLSSTDSKNDSNNDSFYSKSSFTAAIIILLASSQDSWLYSDSSSGEDRDKFGLASIYSNTGSKFNTVSAWEPIPAPLQQSSPSSSSSSSSSSLLSSLTGGNTNTSHTYHNHGSSSSSSSVADMIANVFPALCKIQGAVLDNTGVRKYILLTCCTTNTD